MRVGYACMRMRVRVRCACARTAQLVRVPADGVAVESPLARLLAAADAGGLVRLEPLGHFRVLVLALSPVNRLQAKISRLDLGQISRSGSRPGLSALSAACSASRTHLSRKVHGTLSSPRTPRWSALHMDTSQLNSILSNVSVAPSSHVSRSGRCVAPVIPSNGFPVGLAAGCCSGRAYVYTTKRYDSRAAPKRQRRPKERRRFLKLTGAARLCRRPPVRMCMCMCMCLCMCMCMCMCVCVCVRVCVCMSSCRGARATTSREI